MDRLAERETRPTILTTDTRENKAQAIRFLEKQGWFLALDDGRYVGMTQLFKRNGRMEDLQAGFSAVRRSHRRRGIVTALKTLSIEAARQHGARTIKTGNKENNPMYQINLRLGFKVEPASVAFKRMKDEG